MDEWLFWLIAALILGVGEIGTTGLFLGPFAVGAVVAAILSGIGAATVVNLAVFLVVSVVLLLALRPIARAHMRQPSRMRTGTAALIGRTATVVERVGLDEGSVKLDGEVWRARPYDEDEVIEPGARVHVVEIRGVTALVAQ